MAEHKESQKQEWLAATHVLQQWQPGLYPVLDELQRIMSQNPEGWPHLLFHGPFESNKEMVVRLLVQQLTSCHKWIYLSIEGTPLRRCGNALCVDMEDLPTAQQDKRLTPIIKDCHGRKKYIIFIILHAEKLTDLSQKTLRRLMEPTHGRLSVFLVTEHISAIIEPIATSRCVPIRIPVPQEDMKGLSWYGYHEGKPPQPIWKEIVAEIVSIIYDKNNLKIKLLNIRQRLTSLTNWSVGSNDLCRVLLESMYRHKPLKMGRFTRIVAKHNSNMLDTQNMGIPWEAMCAELIQAVESSNRTL